MNRFDYHARDAAGQAQQGWLDALNPSQAAAVLLARGLTPVGIKQQAGQSAKAGAGPARPSWHWRQWLGEPAGTPRRAPEAAVSLALRELAALLKAGVPILRALRLVADASASPDLRSSCERLITDLDAGRDLASAMDRERERTQVFLIYDVAMVRVGEQTGRLDQALKDVYGHREFLRETREQIVAALRYPMFVVLTCLAALVVVNLLVIPAFAKVFNSLHAQLPLLTRVLLAGSQAMLVGWPLMLALGVGGVWAFRSWTATDKGRMLWDRFKLRIPIVGPILSRIAMARLAATMSSGLRAGLTVTQTLQTTAYTIENAYVAKSLERIRANVERGEALSRAAQLTGLLPPAILQMMVIGEETGSLDELLGEIAEHYRSEVDYAVKRLSASLEPILIMLLGVGVLVLALGVFMPMWELGRASIKS